MSSGSHVSSLAALKAMDRRVLFVGVYLTVGVVAVVAQVLAYQWLNAAAASTTTRLREAARMERIVQQTWWVDEDQKLTSQIGAAKAQFWKGETMGLVRADLERHVQGLLTRHGLKANSVLVETKVTDSKGIALMRAQVKVSGPTAGVLHMLNDLGGGAQELLISGVNIRFFNEQANAEFTLDAPTLVGSGGVAPVPPATLPAPPATLPVKSK